MTRFMGIASLALSLLLTALSLAADPEVRYEIQFPDLPGYKLMACDLHMHTMFSDGLVWPTVRVAEAWRQGLHAIAITDHIEYQPHKSDVPTKHPRPYELAQGAAKACGLLLIRGAEITRDTPPGHFNALFLGDVQPLDTPDFLEAIRRANGQGAFVFWNHQGWQGADAGRWLDVHTTMYANKWFQGMEVCNDDEYYPDAHRWCLEKNLTMLGDSDIHDPDLRTKSVSGNHRTMNLVFVKQRTAEGLKEALKDGRTVVWFKDQLIGREELLRPLFEACVEVRPPIVQTKNSLVVELHNRCDADIRLDRDGTQGPLKVVLPARATVLLKAGISPPGKPVALKYRVSNFLVAPYDPLPVTLRMGPK